MNIRIQCNNYAKTSLLHLSFDLKECVIYITRF